MKTQMTKKEWKEQYSAARLLGHAWAYKCGSDMQIKMKGARKVAHRAAYQLILKMHPSIIYAIRYDYDMSMRQYYMSRGVDSISIRQRLKYPR